MSAPAAAPAKKRPVVVVKPEETITRTQGIHFKPATICNMSKFLINPREVTARLDIKINSVQHQIVHRTKGKSKDKNTIVITTEEVPAKEWSELSSATHEVFEESLFQYELVLFNNFEKALMKEMGSTDSAITYLAKREAYEDAADEADEDFDFRAFLDAEFPKIRTKLDAFLVARDKCREGAKYRGSATGVEPREHTMHTRANMIIGKRLIRFSDSTPASIALFEDLIIEAVSIECLDNCISSGKKQFKIERLFPTAGPAPKLRASEALAAKKAADDEKARLAADSHFALPRDDLLKFVRSTDTYALAREWTARSSELTFKKFAEANRPTRHDKRFVTNCSTAVANLCKSTRVLYAENPALKPEDAEICRGIKISANYRVFGTLLAMETLDRLSRCFAAEVEFSDTRTISCDMVRHVISQTCSAHGIDFERIWEVIEERLAIHRKYKAAMSVTRKLKKLAKAEEDAAEGA